MKSTIPISVIMCFYNEPIEWITEAIDSILQQTFTDFEFIIIDDNPMRDEHSYIHQKYSFDNRVLLITNEYNMGLTKSLNKGLKIAKGDFIVRMDADDISVPHRIEKQYTFMLQNPNCVVCSSRFFLLKGKVKENIVFKPYMFPTGDSEIRRRLLFDNCICHPAAIIRKNTLQVNDITYDETLKYAQDYNLWCVLSNFGEVRNIEEPLIYYRVSNNQISSSKKIQQRLCSIQIRHSYFFLNVEKYGLKISRESIFENICEAISKCNIDVKDKKAMIKSAITTFKIRRVLFPFNTSCPQYYSYIINKEVIRTLYKDSLARYHIFTKFKKR
jgi:glycosyltransferase involved in cell wall biosynthesis